MAITSKVRPLLQILCTNDSPLQRRVDRLLRTGNPNQFTGKFLGRAICVIPQFARLLSTIHGLLSDSEDHEVCRTNRPAFHSFNRKSEIVVCTFAHKVLPFGSKTAHCVPLSIERSRKAK